MDKMDSKKEPLVLKTNMVVSTILKIEIAAVFLFFADQSALDGFSLAVACACINQATEMVYVKMPSVRKRLLVLFISLLLIISAFIVAFSLTVEFKYVQHGETIFEIEKVRLIAKLLLTIFAILGLARLLAVCGDYITNWYDQRSRLVKPIVEQH